MPLSAPPSFFGRSPIRTEAGRSSTISSSPETSSANRLDRARYPGPSGRAFERRPVPSAKVGGGAVGRIEKAEQGRIRILGEPDRVIIENELAQRRIETGGARRDLRLGEAIGRRIGIGIEEGPARRSGAARPEARARHFVAIG